MAVTGTIRLQKFLAQGGVASRRAAESLIQSGRVCVDGCVITEMGCKIDPDRQLVTVDGNRINQRCGEQVYILLNKPKGYVTTLSDPQGRPIVTSLLQNVTHRVFPVGRLDIDTEGALLLTTDGDLAQRILHPRYQTTKSYEALVQGHPSREVLKLLENGIMLEGRKTWPAKVSVIRNRAESTLVSITIHEGRKRQVRKMFGAVGHPVINLTRVAYGKLLLGSLKSGHYRFLNENDLKKIFL